jgi:hypothetical protein
MDKILVQVDEMCAAQGLTRADVLCALFRALVARAPAKRPAPHLSPQECIMRVMRRRHSCTVRELKRNTSSTRIPPIEWDKALRDLIVNGSVTFHLGGKTGLRKVVSLPAKPENEVEG